MTTGNCAGLKDQHFGGVWTEIKIEMVGKYLSAYTQALKYQPSPSRPFKLIYIDAFAGTGQYNNKEDEAVEMDGSAKVALELEQPFGTYYFIDKDSKKLDKLQELLINYTALQSDFIIKNGDANEIICELCDQIDWRYKRAVIFLDPFGLQVRWKTIQAIARTKSIDLWFLFPVSAINRMLKRNGKISDEWSAKLDDVLGTHDWYGEFYTKSPQLSLLGFDQGFKKTANFDNIIEFSLKRLESEFSAVHQQPRVFTNKSNSPLFALCFAVGNESEAAKKLAMKIAGHILIN